MHFLEQDSIYIWLVVQSRVLFAIDLVSDDNPSCCAAGRLSGAFRAVLTWSANFGWCQQHVPFDEYKTEVSTRVAPFLIPFSCWVLRGLTVSVYAIFKMGHWTDCLQLLSVLPLNRMNMISRLIIIVSSRVAWVPTFLFGRRGKEKMEEKIEDKAWTTHIAAAERALETRLEYLQQRTACFSSVVTGSYGDQWQ